MSELLFFIIGTMLGGCIGIDEIHHNAVLVFYAAVRLHTILDADSFVGVDFSARSNERSRDYER